MNTNTLKAALSKFTGKKFEVINRDQYMNGWDKSPAVIQDAMHIGEFGYIVTRCYGAGFEVYKVVGDDTLIQYFKEV